MPVGYGRRLFCGSSLGGCFFLLFGFEKIGVASLHEDVVPLDELLDIAGIDAVGIVVGQHFVKEGVELCLVRLAGVDVNGLAVLFLLDGFEYLHKRLIIVHGVHGDIAEGGDAVARTGGDATLLLVDGFHNQIAVAASNEAVEAGLARDGENGFFHF